jgi:hypothetical protein
MLTSDLLPTADGTLQDVFTGSHYLVATNLVAISQALAKQTVPV